VGRYREAEFQGLAEARASARTVLPDERRDKRAGRAQAVAIEKMKLGRILEARGPLDQSQAQEARIEIDVALGIRRYQGDVMDAGSGCHDPPIKLLGGCG